MSLGRSFVTSKSLVVKRMTVASILVALTILAFSCGRERERSDRRARPSATAGWAASLATLSSASNDFSDKPRRAALPARRGNRCRRVRVESGAGFIALLDANLTDFALPQERHHLQ